MGPRAGPGVGTRNVYWDTLLILSNGGTGVGVGVGVGVGAGKGEEGKAAGGWKNLEKA
jgi:hypothetical protein